MKHSAATEQLFDQVIADTPPEIKCEVAQIFLKELIFIDDKKDKN